LPFKRLFFIIISNVLYDILSLKEITEWSLRAMPLLNIIKQTAMRPHGNSSDDIFNIREFNCSSKKDIYF
jgi:hypothetical protein